MAGIGTSGSVMSGMYGPQKKKPNPVEDMYKTYGGAVKQQAADYDEIMGKFRGIYDEAGGPGGSGGKYGFIPYQPERAVYNKSPDTIAALANLKGLTETGGLSADEQQNLRARGISPIRAMYATANRDMSRNRSLSGGYSPNFGAVTAKMTRDQSSLVADQMDKVNGNIAEMVQRGKLGAAPQYAGAAQAESELGNKFNLSNAEMANEAKRFNASGMFDSERARRGDRTGAAAGMANLYGTTPALVNTFGNQAMDTAKFTDNVNQRKKATGLAGLASMTRR